MASSLTNHRLLQTLKRFYLGRQQEMTKLIDTGKLPAPLKTIKKGQTGFHWGFDVILWMTHSTIEIHELQYNPNNYFHQYLLDTGQLFATAEDVKNWLQAMSNARK